jgi:signal transduction histidine kinase
MKASLRASLTGLWVLIVVLCLALGFLMTALFYFSVGAQVRSTQAQVENAGANIEARFAFYLASFGENPPAWSEESRRRELELILQMVLANFPGVEGGFWTPDRGFVAYSFPTYEGTVPKKDVPEAEVGRISEVTRAAASNGKLETRRFTAPRESLVISARPASPNVPNLAIWTMARAHVSVGEAYERLTWGVVVLFFLAFVSGGWVLSILVRWLRRLRALENSIAAAPLDEKLNLPETGQADLDRIVSALNQLSTKLYAAREESRSLSRDLSRAERTTALARMAAQLAHEIRNPIASVRLRAENALTKSSEHQTAALRSTIQEIARVDDLLERLLAVSRLDELRRQPVPLSTWLNERVENFRAQAERASVRLEAEAPDARADFDPQNMARALDNLLINALRHTPANGTVTARAKIDNARWVISVEDTGTGISEDMREKLFEPFATTRTEGVGLGLSIAREIVEAHGGTLRAEAGANGGARFVIELPQEKSAK